MTWKWETHHKGIGIVVRSLSMLLAIASWDFEQTAALPRWCETAWRFCDVALMWCPFDTGEYLLASWCQAIARNEYYSSLLFTHFNHTWQNVTNIYQRKRLRQCPWRRHQMETFSALLDLCEEIRQSPVDSPHKGQWCGALMFSSICDWTNGWVNNRDTSDLKRHRAHYDVTVMGIWNTLNKIYRTYSLYSLCRRKRSRQCHDQLIRMKLSVALLTERNCGTELMS